MRQVHPNHTIIVNWSKRGFGCRKRCSYCQWRSSPHLPHGGQAAPTTGPARACIPPSSTITRASTDLPTVMTSGEVPRRHYLWNLPKVFKGTHVDEPELDIVPAREVAFSSDRPFIAYADGDPIAECPVTVRVLPGALKVLAP